MSRLSRELIARAAIAIADADGVEALSMRRVAAHLGVGTMSLYHHVGDRQGLYTLMGDTIMARQIIPAAEVPDGWRAGLAEIAVRMHGLFRAHPWILAGWHDADRGEPGSSFVRHVEQTLAIMADLDFLPIGERMALSGLVDEYVMGHLMRHVDVADLDQRWTDYLAEQAASGQFPHLAEAFAAGLHRDQRPGAFQHGLRIVLDGIERYVEARRPGSGI